MAAEAIHAVDRVEEFRPIKGTLQPDHFPSPLRALVAVLRGNGLSIVLDETVANPGEVTQIQAVGNKQAGDVAKQIMNHPAYKTLEAAINPLLSFSVTYIREEEHTILDRLIALRNLTAARHVAAQGNLAAAHGDQQEAKRQWLSAMQILTGGDLIFPDSMPIDTDTESEDAEVRSDNDCIPDADSALDGFRRRRTDPATIDDMMVVISAILPTIYSSRIPKVIRLSA